MLSNEDSDAIDAAAAVLAISRISAVPTILDVVCKTTGMGFAAVARVTDSRWIACSVRDIIAFGLQPGGELKLETTICHEIRQTRRAVVIDHVDKDPLFASHHTPAMYGLQSYISMPIVLSDGSFFGTLCAIDREPRILNTPETIGMFALFASLIAFHLDANQRVLDSEADLKTERRNTELREQFIAVLGHDLRNPLASIEAGTRVLQRSLLEEKNKAVVALIQSSVTRMFGIIDNVLDFARGRLGGGLGIESKVAVPLGPMLEQVIAEFRSSHPERQIDADIEDVSIRCDAGRIGQLLSNLIANALTHGASEGAIRVRAAVSNGEFELVVANRGNAIPHDIHENLFKPFVRASALPNKQGLGLGLYIASEIALAHQGTLDVVSSDDETQFIFRMKAPQNMPVLQGAV